MKTLVVHHGESYHKFEGAYSKFLFEIEGDVFKLYQRDPHTGDERLYACFKDWDYFLIEEEV